MIDEGYIKFKSYWEKSGPLSHVEIQDLIFWRKALYAAGLIGYYADTGIGYGNISTRTGLAGQFVISGTRTGQVANPGNEHFALVTAYDIACNSVHSTGATEASSESMTHATIYDLDPEIRAVVHVHNTALWEMLKGTSPCTDEHIAYGTPEMAQEFKRLFRDTDFPASGIAVMAGHDDGLISTGATTQQAAERLLSLYGNL